MKLIFIAIWLSTIFITYKLTYHYAFLDGEAFVANAVAERAMAVTDEYDIWAGRIMLNYTGQPIEPAVIWTGKQLVDSNGNVIK